MLCMYIIYFSSSGMRAVNPIVTVLIEWNQFMIDKYALDTKINTNGDSVRLLSINMHFVSLFAMQMHFLTLLDDCATNS